MSFHPHYDKVRFILQLRGIEKVIFLAKTHISQFKTLAFHGIKLAYSYCKLTWYLQDISALSCH